MHEFLEPTEERVILPTALTDTERTAVECEELCSEIERLCRGAKRDLGRTISLYAILVMILGFSGMIGLFVGMYEYLGIMNHLFGQLAALIPLSILALAREADVFLTKRTLSARRAGRALRDILCKIDANPTLPVAPYLLRLSGYLQFLDKKIIGIELSKQFLSTVDALLFRVSTSNSTHFHKRHISVLDANLASFGYTAKTSEYAISPFAVVNALKYVGNDASLRVMRSLLKKPAPPHNTYQVLLRQTIEATIPIIEARLAREQTSQTLLRPSQLIDESTLLRPSQEQGEPAEELLRPVQDRE